MNRGATIRRTIADYLVFAAVYVHGAVAYLLARVRQGGGSR